MQSAEPGHHNYPAGLVLPEHCVWRLLLYVNDLCFGARGASLIVVEDPLERRQPSELPYRYEFDRWIKVKNRSHPAFSRVMDSF